MGQPNEKEYPLLLLDKFNSYENIIKNDIFLSIDKTFITLRSIIE